ncbi:MAG: hypothetical protein ACI31G_02765 [Bacilli bacterium]
MIALYISLSALVPILFISFYFSSKIIFNKKYQYPYDIRNHFPFEFNDNGYKENIIPNLFLILSSLLYIPLIIGFYHFDKNGYFLFSSIALILILIFINLLSFVPLSKLKEHLAISSFLFSFSFLAFLSLSVGLFSLYQNEENILLLIIGIITSIIALFSFIAIMVLSFHKLEKMEDKQNEDGTITKIRSKYILLAFFEWLSFFIIYFSPFILTLIYVSL